MDRDLWIGVLEGFCRSLSDCFGSLFGLRCVGTWNLGDLGVGRWFLGSNFHFLLVCCRLCLFVGWDLGMIVLSGGGLFLSGFLALVIFVVSGRRK